MTTATQTDEEIARTVMRARDNLLDFAQYTMPSYRKAPHLEMVADALEEIERGENDRLFIELPPRHGKSELVSVRFPAWLICKHPDWPIIAASYGERLAMEWGRRTRDLVSVQPLFPNIKLDPSSKSKDLWHTHIRDNVEAEWHDSGGQFLSGGVGSGIFGFGARIYIIDDPYGKAEGEENISESRRIEVRNFWEGSVLTRLEPGSAIIIIMHRWHEDDLIGMLKQEQPDRWKEIRLPALAEADDPLGREEGEALWPWRYPKETLDELRLPGGIGERKWNALYQQRPSPAEGAIFKWFPRYETHGKIQKIVVGVDTAYTAKSGSDFTAWAAWGFDGSQAFLLEAGRFKGSTPDAERRIIHFVHRMSQKYSCRVQTVVRGAVAIDRIAAQHLRVGQTAQTPDGLRRMGIPVHELKLPMSVSKTELGDIVSTEFEGERALIPERAPWLDIWIEEHKAFPYSKHDDWVETTIIALWYLFRARPFKRPRALNIYAENA